MSLRIGLGFDVHRLVEGRPCVLGGVAIPHPHGLKGHSDGDALLHAVADAVLGAAGLGSLGEQFPDTDPAWRDADSQIVDDYRGALRRKSFRNAATDAAAAAGDYRHFAVELTHWCASP